MSFLKRHPHPHPDDLDTDDEPDAAIDPELRLRTVRTAASALAESVRSEQRAERRKSIRRKRSLFFRTRGAEKKRPGTAASGAGDAAAPRAQVAGARRNIYVNCPPSAMEVDQGGEPLARYVRNKVRTTSECALLCFAVCAGAEEAAEYTLVTFIPKNLYEQFRR